MSSLLGVAGRELIIPTLVFVFGADIKIAGTVSITISLPTAAVGIARYATRGAYHSRADLGSLVAPMGLGSILGALLGGALVPYAPAGLLKIGLGAILVVSAVRIFRHANPRD
ncbi:MAG: sulfite exporter TauE/SafE family protein [Myxococcales bacterium]|nr:sulfite exporter TauE/SafE family protein [Myxococcales bacterium]